MASLQRQLAAGASIDEVFCALGDDLAPLFLVLFFSVSGLEYFPQVSARNAVVNSKYVSAYKCVYGDEHVSGDSFSGPTNAVAYFTELETHRRSSPSRRMPHLGPLGSLPVEWRLVLQQWAVFLRAELHIVSALLPSTQLGGAARASLAAMETTGARPMSPWTHAIDLACTCMDTLGLHTVVKSIARDTAVTPLLATGVADAVKAWRITLRNFVSPSDGDDDALERTTELMAKFSNPLGRYGAYPYCNPYALLPLAGISSTDSVTSTAISVHMGLYNIQLLPLPREYTRLHARVVKMCAAHKQWHNEEGSDGINNGSVDSSSLVSASPYSFPAICLVCGALVDAGGLGQCCAHSEVSTDHAAEKEGRTACCASETGVFFLLQVLE